MNDFIVAINAVIPFFLYMTGGYILNRVRPMKKEFIAQMNSMVFNYFYPFIIFSNLYKMDRSKGFNTHILLVVFGGIFAILIVSLIITKKTAPDNSRRGVIVQAMFRSNSILFAIPLARSVFGAAGGEISAVVGSAVSPVYNVIAVIMFETFRGGKTSVKKLIKNILVNPIMIGAYAAIIVILTGVRFPSAIEGVVEQVSSMGSCLALILLGMTLSFGAMKKNRKCLIVFTALKMAVIPAIVLAVIMAMDFTPVERFAIFSTFATPAAIASYTTAANMGGDGELAGQIVFLTTAVSVVTMFLWIFFLKRAGVF